LLFKFALDKVQNDSQTYLKKKIDKVYNLKEKSTRLKTVILVFYI